MSPYELLLIEKDLSKLKCLLLCSTGLEQHECEYIMIELFSFMLNHVFGYNFECSIQFLPVYNRGKHTHTHTHI